MTVATRYAKFRKEYNENLSVFKDRTLRGQGMIMANEMARHHHEKLYLHQPISTISLKIWADREENIDRTDIPIFERYIIEELKYLGYKGEIKAPSDSAKSITLTVIEDTEPLA